MLHAALLASVAVSVLGLLCVALNLVLIPRLSRQRAASGGRPRVSIVIPARNEERDVEAAVRSHREQDYPTLEIVVVEDRSTDATAAILERLAREDSRITVVSGAEPPAGWLGKPHALSQGVAAASGEWVLFADADVRYDPRALSQAMAYAQARGLDFLVLLPRIEARGFWENVLMPYLLMAVFQAPAFLANRPRPRWIAGGGGAGNLIRRSAYDAIGGHATLRDSVVDDVRLGYVVKAAGFAFGMVRAEDRVAVRMYRGLRQILDGFTKNIAYVYQGATGLGLLLLTVATLGAALLPGATLLAVLFGLRIPGVDLALALAGYASAVLARIVLASVMSDPRWPAVTHPIMAAVWFGMLVRSMYHRFVRRRLKWRGREFEARAARF
jgi:chlorobactene glucosyltransferase